jgi:hypothetical protein
VKLAGVRKGTESEHGQCDRLAITPSRAGRLFALAFNRDRYRQPRDRAARHSRVETGNTRIERPQFATPRPMDALPAQVQ